MKKNDGRSGQRGYTLVEMLVALAVGGVLLAQGVPSLRAFLLGRQVQGHAMALADDLRRARAEAIQRGARVTLCPSVDGRQCAGAAANRDWSRGWLVFQDSGTRGVVEPGDSLLRVQGEPAVRLRVAAGGLASYVVSYLPSGVAPGAQNNVRFQPDGSGDAPMQSQRVLCIGATGSTRIAAGASC